jgi:hypothetical protein
MSVDMSGEITAIATAILAFFAIVTAWYARRAFLKQSREVSILAEQNERDSGDRRRAQASRVFIWTEPTGGVHPQDGAVAGIISHIKNTSEQPIYDGLIACSDGSGRTADDPVIPAFPVLMPGEQQDVTSIFAAPVAGVVFWEDNSALLAGLGFRDAAGARWRIRSDGRLDEDSAAGEPAVLNRRRA